MRDFGRKVFMSKFFNILFTQQQFTDWALHLLYPKRCPFCDRVMFQSVLVLTPAVCAECEKKIEYIKEPVCKICGRPVFSPQQEKCFDCETKKHFFIQGKALFVYKGIVRESIYRFKYAGRREYGDYYGKEISRYYEKWIRDKTIDAIIPIPLHKSRKRQRGFNQAEELAHVIGRQFNIPVRINILKRVKKTRPQKELNNIERKNNLKKAFKIHRNEVQLTHILLVDDIYTTGNTIDEAAKELINSGVKCIYYICISIGRGYEEEKIWM